MLCMILFLTHGLSFDYCVYSRITVANIVEMKKTDRMTRFLIENPRNRIQRYPRSAEERYVNKTVLEY